MPGVAAFMEDPADFMRKNIVQQMVAGMGVDGTTDWFTFRESSSDGECDGKSIPVYEMVQANSSTPTDDKFKSYWCPYQDEHVHSVTVASAANYCFTAKMDGCSFGIGMAGGDKSVTVAHANLQEVDDFDELDRLIIAEAIKRPKDQDPAALRRLNLAKLKLKGQLQSGLLTGGDGVGGGLSTGIGPLDYKQFGLIATTFGVRSGTGDWSFFFHAYTKKGVVLDLIGCFPFPSR